MTKIVETIGFVSRLNFTASGEISFLSTVEGFRTTRKANNFIKTTLEKLIEVFADC